LIDVEYDIFNFQYKYIIHLHILVIYLENSWLIRFAWQVLWFYISGWNYAMLHVSEWWSVILIHCSKVRVGQVTH